VKNENQHLEDRISNVKCKIGNVKLIMYNE
jgi:hypothetical protein